MRCRSRIAAGLSVLVCSLVMSLPASADNQEPEIFPFEKIRRGQKGYGMTTFQGTTPERFEFEVIGINKNMLPKMDIILVKSDDPKLAVSGFWRGMSGSPLYIEGKLACAFSYGFRFNKVSIGGCTPLHYMKKQGFMIPRRVYDETSGTAIKSRNNKTKQRAKKPRKSRAKPAVSMNEWLKLAPQRTVQSAMNKLGKPRENWLTSAPMPRPPRRATSTSDMQDGMVAAAIPLSLSGFSSRAFDEAKALMSRYAIEPMRAGGTGNPDEGPTRFQPGAPFGITIVRGDMSMSATCTVSYVDRDRMLGCGHPLFEAGEIYAPVTAAQVHTVIPSALSAFVIASPMRELGSLVQDRQATVMADTRLKTRMIPLDIYVEAKGANNHKLKEEFHAEVINNRFLTAPFAGISTISAISSFLPDRDQATVAIESVVHLRGHKPLQFSDYLYSDDGASSTLGGARGLRAVFVLLNNPYAPVVIERLELRAKVIHEINFGRIKELRLPTVELTPGKRSVVDVVMRTYDGKDIIEKVPFDVPKHLAGSIVRLKVSSGDRADLDVAPPQNVDQMINAFRQLLPGNVFAVTLSSANEGVAIDGKLVRDLPPSALDRLRPRSRTQRAGLYRAVSRSTYPSRRVINGSGSMLVQIADK